MTMTSHVAGKALIACCFALACVSCGSARLYKGYGYQGSAGAPDMSGQVTNAPIIPAAQPEPVNADIPMEPPVEGMHAVQDKAAEVQSLISQSVDQPVPVRETAGSALDDAARMAAEGKPINHQSLAREMTSRMVSEGKIQPLGAQQQQKLDRLTEKMDKKLQQQGREIDWKNNTGLELFFMIMAIAGLVLGIIGVAFGWFVFIVFAGLWLYWKLVKD